MPGPPAPDVTQLLLAWGEGDRGALDRLVPLVYAELHRLARHHMRRELAARTLQTTALVNEAYVRLIDAKRVPWQSRAHFFAVSAKLMRQILVDAARARRASKRGGDVDRVCLEDAPDIGVGRGEDLVALDEALGALAAVDPRKEQVVELRHFGGLSVEETAEVLKVSVDTVMRDWKLAKAWLRREMVRGQAIDAARDG